MTEPALRRARHRLVRIIATLGMTSLLLAACGSADNSGDRGGVATGVVEPGERGYTNVSPAELAGRLEQNDFTLVNVHIPYEGEIAGTSAFIPYNKIDQHLEDLPAEHNVAIILYCQSGRMSGIAAETLVRLGYSDVWNLDGGMIAWEEAGYRLVNQRR